MNETKKEKLDYVSKNLGKNTSEISISLESIRDRG